MNTTVSFMKTPDPTYTKIPTSKMLLWLSMVSMVMLFAGLTSGYIVRQAEGNWLVFQLPSMFTISTIFIIASSISMQWAFNAIKQDKAGNLVTGLIITLVLGLAFTFTQVLGWSALVNEGIFFTGNPSGSFLYVLTALHLAHLAGGVIFLIYVTFRALQGKFHSGDRLPVELCTIFWHFLDFLWIYLFLFLYFIR